MAKHTRIVQYTPVDAQFISFLKQLSQLINTDKQ